MKKKTYRAPAMQVVRLAPTLMLGLSNTESNKPPQAPRRQAIDEDGDDDFAAPRTNLWDD